VRVKNKQGGEKNFKRIINTIKYRFYTTNVQLIYSICYKNK
jgi:hypothetical protein